MSIKISRNLVTACALASLQFGSITTANAQTANGAVLPFGSPQLEAPYIGVGAMGQVGPTRDTPVAGGGLFFSFPGYVTRRGPGDFWRFGRVSGSLIGNHLALLDADATIVPAAWGSRGGWTASDRSADTGAAGSAEMEFQFLRTRIRRNDDLSLHLGIVSAPIEIHGRGAIRIPTPLIPVEVEIDAGISVAEVVGALFDPAVVEQVPQRVRVNWLGLNFAGRLRFNIRPTTHVVLGGGVRATMGPTNTWLDQGIARGAIEYRAWGTIAIDTINPATHRVTSTCQIEVSRSRFNPSDAAEDPRMSPPESPAAVTQAGARCQYYF